MAQARKLTGPAEIRRSVLCFGRRGFALLPRLKNLKRQRLYRPQNGDPGKYANLQAILTRPINWEIIEQQYDELIKFATALRLGTADAESRLLGWNGLARGNRQSG